MASNAEYLITSGNEAGLGIPDYIAFFADQPELKVIIVYIEAISDLAKFKAACRLAREAGKAIVGDKARSIGERPRAPRWRIPDRSPAPWRRSTR